MSVDVLDRMTDADVAAVVAIDAAAEGSSGWDEAQVRGELERSWAALWVIRRAGAPIAFACTWLVADELHVLNVATHRAHLRSGHARRILTNAIEWAVERGVRLVLLEVRRSNVAALRLYRALGFAPVNVRPRYYDDGEDAVEMQLRLDERGRHVPCLDEITL